MSLPKIKSPIYDAIIPSNQKSITIRPFDVKEEKILLMARQSGQPSDYFKAIAQVVQNCIQDSSVDVMKHPLFDVSAIFLKVRMHSVSNIAKVQYRDNEDGETYSFDIDLDTVKVKFPEEPKLNYKVNDSVSFTMKYPSMELYTDKEFFDLEDDKVFDHLAVSCLDKIFEGERVHDCADVKKEEKLEFINSLPAKFYSELRDFFSDIPSIYHKIEYVNKKGTNVEIELRTIEDFFT